MGQIFLVEVSTLKSQGHGKQLEVPKELIRKADAAEALLNFG